MAWIEIADEFTIDDIGARLLANLAKGIYHHEAVLREYVQNACDAYKALIADTKEIPDDEVIHIDVEDDSTIAIQDYGLGMDLHDVKKAKRIAVSNKTVLSDMIGFRGIGIWAGFQACEKLELTTTKRGSPKRYRLEIDFAEILKRVDDNINIKELLDGRFRIEEEDNVDKDEHYTRVRLIGLDGDYRQLANNKELERIVSQVLPCKIDPKFKFKADLDAFLNTVVGFEEYSILVDRNEVYKSFPDGDKFQTFTLRADSNEVGKVWWVSGHGSRQLDPSRYQYRNFRLRVKNFAVGREGIYDDENASTFGITSGQLLTSRPVLQWHVGEIYITHPEIRPDTPRNNLELDYLSRRAIEAIRLFYTERIAESRAISDFKGYRDAVAKSAILAAASTVNPGEVNDALQNLNEQLALSRSRPAASEIKKKLLREMVRQRDHLKAVREGHKSLEELRKKFVSGAAPVQPKPAPAPSTTTTASKPPVASVAPAVTATTLDIDGEELLSDIFAAVESAIGSDDEMYPVICDAIYKIFNDRGLLDAEE